MPPDIFTQPPLLPPVGTVERKPRLSSSLRSVPWESPSERIHRPTVRHGGSLHVGPKGPRTSPRNQDLPSQAACPHTRLAVRKLCDSLWVGHVRVSSGFPKDNRKFSGAETTRLQLHKHTYTRKLDWPYAPCLSSFHGLRKILGGRNSWLLPPGRNVDP